jgi:hypothetical protein
MKIKITKKQMLKIVRKVKRQIELEEGNKLRGGPHLTSKKDKHRKSKNTVQHTDFLL